MESLADKIPNFDESKASLDKMLKILAPYLPVPDAKPVESPKPWTLSETISEPVGKKGSSLQTCLN
jgi:hypothetical protein